MAEYRIDDLARAAGTTVRNVRVYQDRGLLPAPRREGRVGVYSDAHLARLRLIGQLLERGYTFALIADLITAWTEDRDLADVLGLEEALIRPWSDEAPATMTLVELRRMFGKQATPGAIERATHSGFVRREGTRFRVPSPRLLEAGADLVNLGIPMHAVLDLAEAVSGDLDVVARRFVELLGDQLLDEDGVPLRDLHETTELVDKLRPQAVKAVDAIFAAAMERAITAEIERIIKPAARGRAAERPVGRRRRATED